MTYPEFVSVDAHTYHGDIAFHRWGNERITIGKWCSISQGVKILAGGNHRTDAVSTFPFDTLLSKTASNPIQDRSYDKGGNIDIGNDVWIGYGASILGSVKIGHGAVIAANATVFTDIPPYAIAVGNPARVTKYRFSQAQIDSLLRINWCEWSEQRIKDRVDDFYLHIERFVSKYDPAQGWSEHFDSCHCSMCRDANGKQHPVLCSGVLSCSA